MTTLKIGDVVLDEVRSAPEKETVFENDSLKCYTNVVTVVANKI